MSDLPRWPDTLTLVAVALGGAVGSLGRYAVGLLLPHATGEFPWATFAVNVSGALAMGLLVGWLSVHWEAPPLLRPFAAVGVLGGWTTFSALAVDVVGLTRSGHDLIALLYVAGTFLVGTLLVGAGITVAQRLWEPV